MSIRGVILLAFSAMNSSTMNVYVVLYPTQPCPSFTRVLLVSKVNEAPRQRWT